MKPIYECPYAENVAQHIAIRLDISFSSTNVFPLTTNHHQRDDHPDGLCRDCAKSRICRTKLKIPHEQVDECDIETLIPKLAGTTWLNHYLESLPNLEAQKQMCRQVISM